MKNYNIKTEGPKAWAEKHGTSLKIFILKFVENFCNFQYVWEPVLIQRILTGFKLNWNICHIMKTLGYPLTAYNIKMKNIFLFGKAKYLQALQYWRAWACRINQGSKGIGQWHINRCISQKIIHKISLF